MQSGNLAHMGNIAGMDHTSTRWWVRLEQGRSHNRVLRNRVLHSREQSLKPPQETRAQDPGQERLRLPRSSLRHANLLRIHNFLYIQTALRKLREEIGPRSSQRSYNVSLQKVHGKLVNGVTTKGRRAPNLPVEVIDPAEFVCLELDGLNAVDPGTGKTVWYSLLINAARAY